LLTQDGSWIITTMGEEVLVTEVKTGKGVGKIRGVSAVFVLSGLWLTFLGYYTDHFVGSQLPHFSSNTHHLSPIDNNPLLPTARIATSSRRFDTSARLHKTNPSRPYLAYPSFCHFSRHAACHRLGRRRRQSLGSCRWICDPFVQRPRRTCIRPVLQLPGPD
jgi:hypothetical protein